MEIRVNRECNFISEILDLFYNLQNEESPKEVKKSILEKYDLKDEEIINKFDKVIEVTDDFLDHLQVGKEKLGFYFKDLNEERCTVADFVLLRRTLIIEESLEERAARIKSMTDEERLSEYVKVLDGLINEEDRSESIRKTDTFYDFLQVLDTSEISSEDKWNIQKVFINHSTFVDELVGIMQSVMPSFVKWKNEMEKWLEQTYVFASRFTSFNDLCKVLRISMSELSDASRIIIQPSFFKLNTISISSKDEEDTCYIVMGCMYDDSFTAVWPAVNKVAVYTNLKILSDKSKFDILLYLKDRSAYGLELSKQFNLSTPTISHHMGALISAGFVEIKKKQNRLYYTTDKERLKEFLTNVQNVLIET